MTFRRRLSSLTLIVCLATVAALQILPLAAAFSNSFRTDKEIKKLPIGLPTRLNPDNYVKAWKIGGYSKAFANSVVVSVSTTAAIVACSLIAGFFLARVTSKFTQSMIVYFGVALSIPVFSFLVPVYYAFAELKLVNTLVGLILIFVATNLPFNILLARTYILGIPRELDEAATIDGCSTYQVLWSIICPISKPIITTIALIVFVSTWNEFTIANTFLQSPELKTAATRFVLFVGERGSDLSMVHTAAMVTILPIIIVFILLQNYFIEGMTAGSIK